jgi:protein-S-isoprenylcysteine O-methyltransferase Ste14
MARGMAAFLYGLICYLIFFVTFLYAVGFVANAVVPKSIDSGTAGPLLGALIVNLLLLGVFAVQHTIMARPAFKRWWTRLVPASVERSTFVLATSLALLLLFWQWRPIQGMIWDVQNPSGRVLLWAICGVGWITVFLGTFMINHFHLFGLYQVWNRLLGRDAPEPIFQTRGLYGYVRHPLMLGFIVAFWATPTMTLGHLIFAAATTGYIVLGTRLFEERDLVRFIGMPYQKYQKKVPAFLPRLGRGVRVEELLSGPNEPAAEAEI